MKKALVLVIALIFTIGMVSLGFAQDVKGTVTKVVDKKITVEVTVEVKDLGGAKVGDEVEIKAGVVKVTKKAPEKKAPEKKAPGY